MAAAGLWLVGDGLYIRAKAVLAQHLLAGAWADTLDGAEGVKPWSWADTWPVARLSVPRLGIDHIVLAGGSGRTLAFGPGHVDGTALPGMAGTSIIGGHRDTHFRFLEKVATGDAIEVERADGAVRRYSVEDVRIVHKDAARMPAGDGAPVLVLSTCYPFDAVVPGGPLRYVVTARADNTDRRLAGM
ncbi:MAG: class GN sortase [Alphaproteobacteria bacterium]|nr:class GN sortase [Alphaproteobacteria bacterium]